MVTIERALTRLNRAIALRLFARSLTLWTGAVCFAWGTAILATRVALGTPRSPLLWGAMALAPVAFASWLNARRGRPPTDALRALIDYTSQAGGLVMAEGETGFGLGLWRSQVPSPAQTVVRWRDRRATGLCVLAALFVAAAFAVPNQYVDTLRHHNRLAIGSEAERLGDKIDALAGHRILPEDRTDALRRQLSDIEQTASGADPARTWEALDHLEQALNRDAQNAAQALASRAEPLARAETLGKGLERHAGQMPLEAKTQAMKDLAELARQAGGAGNEANFGEMDIPGGDMPGDLRQALDNLCNNPGEGLDPEQLEQIQRWARQLREGDLDALRDLQRLGMIDPAALGPAEQLEGFDPEDLLRLAQGMPGGDPADGDPLGGNPMGGDPGNGELFGGNLADGILGLGIPGAGGITRGPGPATLNFTNDTRADGAEFKEQALTPAGLASLKDSQLLGISTGAPEPVTDGYTVTTGALSGAEAGEGSARTHTILPKHRAAVERFFERGP